MTLRQRAGDQPLPVTTDPATPGAHDFLIDALTQRRRLGIERYGSTLQPHSGRDTGRDLVEELLDAAVYARTLQTELADLEETLRRVVMDYADTVCDGEDDCSMAYARRLLARRGIAL